MDMIETKLACLQMEVSKGNGEVMLLIETACGFRLVMGWPNLSCFQDFISVLVGICSQMSCKEGSNDITRFDYVWLDRINNGKRILPL